MTLIICIKTYKKFGLVVKNCVGTLVCLIYIQNVKDYAYNGNFFHTTTTTSAHDTKFLYGYCPPFAQANIFPNRYPHLPLSDNCAH